MSASRYLIASAVLAAAALVPLQAFAQYGPGDGQRFRC